MAAQERYLELSSMVFDRDTPQADSDAEIVALLKEITGQNLDTAYIHREERFEHAATIQEEAKGTLVVVPDQPRYMVDFGINREYVLSTYDPDGTIGLARGYVSREMLEALATVQEPIIVPVPLALVEYDSKQYTVYTGNAQDRILGRDVQGVAVGEATLFILLDWLIDRDLSFTKTRLTPQESLELSGYM